MVVGSAACRDGFKLPFLLSRVSRQTAGDRSPPGLEHGGPSAVSPMDLFRETRTNPLIKILLSTIIVIRFDCFGVCSTFIVVMWRACYMAVDCCRRAADTACNDDHGDPNDACTKN